MSDQGGYLLDDDPMATFEKMIAIAEEEEKLNLKKNRTRPRKGRSSGNHGTPLIGVTKAASAMQHKARSNGTGEKSSAG